MTTPLARHCQIVESIGYKAKPHNEPRQATRGHSLTDDEIVQAHQMAVNGKTNTQIAEALGVSRNQIQTKLKRGIKRGHRDGR